jgi:tRNA(adenine34) deaminase
MWLQKSICALLIDMSFDEQCISRCIKIADQCFARGELPFGCIITYQGKVVAEGFNTGLSDLTGHAEVNAMRQLRMELPDVPFKDCTLYSNFEPCAMCSYLIRDFGIGRVVFSFASPHVGGFSKWNILSADISVPFTSKGLSTPPEVIGGILESQGRALFDKLNWKMHDPKGIKD